MYWPIGPPKVYALSKHATSRSSTTQSHDGVESAEPSSSSVTDDLKSSSHESSKSDSETPDGSQQSSKAERRTEDFVARESAIVSAKIARSGAIFATITRSALTIWQAKPTVALASVIRSPQSMKAYGPNDALLLRPDAMVIVVQTTQGYLITYSLSADPNARVYAAQLPPTSGRHAHKDSVDGSYTSYRKHSIGAVDAAAGGPGEGDGIKEVNMRFRMVIRIDAGISKAIALDDEIVVATKKPGAVQCIRWVADGEARTKGQQHTQTSTELLSKMQWVVEKCTVVEIVHDRPMNLTCWITSDGRAYAVQRRSAADVDMDDPTSLFQGFCFREGEEAAAVKTAINARFSLIAVGCADGSIEVFTVKDYMGNIPLSHTVQPPNRAGALTFLSWSPDGYCLLAGYETGWATWSVYGKSLAHSAHHDRTLAARNDEGWLQGVKDALWLGGGCELILVGMADDRLWSLDMARNALTGCYSPSNLGVGLLHSNASVMLYKGHDIPDLTSLPSDLSLWQTIQVPASYLLHQWPIKSAVTSADGKYIAVAGRRGLAHYSVLSGRWKTFDDPATEHEFSVRGGMAWFQHWLIACVESTGSGNRSYQVRIYSREKSLNYSSAQHAEDLPAPAIFMTVSGTDSLLVYTYDNTLLHYIIIPSGSNNVKLVQVGQIGFHGIIRAPPRVRALSWLLPEDQLEHGDPSQDVATASVLFLVDGKLVLLQPSMNEHGELKYDMRVVANNVEFYSLLRDHPALLSKSQYIGGEGYDITPATPHPNGTLFAFDQAVGHHPLHDSLWYFDGSSIQIWPDIQDVLASAPADLGRDLPPTVRIPVDFYPLATLVSKSIITGLDSELSQRRDIPFSFFRLGGRTALFLPRLLRHHLEMFDSPAALHLSQSYQHLPYFAHALEVLLHDILDAEVDTPPEPPETALLPTVISFLSSFPQYLDIVVNCTRKTELRSWRTLFAALPVPVHDLFEESLSQNKLKTAAGYLLVLHTFEEERSDTGEGLMETHQFARMLCAAVVQEDWELCGELARFLVGIDGSGRVLRAALKEARLGEGVNGNLVALNGMSEKADPIDYFSMAQNRRERDEEFETPADA